MQLTQDAFIYLTMAVLSMALSFVAWQRRLVLGAIEMTMLMLLVGLWSFMLFCQSIASELATKLLWSNASYLFVTCTPVTYLVFVYKFLGIQNRIKLRHWLFLYIVPVVTVLLIWTNSDHHLVWTGIDPLTHPGELIRFHRGPWFWVGVVFYSYLMMGLSTWLLCWYVYHNRRVFRLRGWIMLFAAIFPLLLSVLFVTGMAYEHDIKIFPFLLLVSGGLFTIAFYYSGAYNLLPVARELLIDVLPDGIITLDQLNRVQDINNRAIQMLGLSKKHRLGLDLKAVEPGYNVLAEAILSTEIERTVTMEGKGAPVYHILKVIPKNLQGCCLVIIRDITETINYQNKIEAEEQKYREMSSFFQLLADNMPDMLWAKDLNLRFTFTNKSLVEEVLMADSPEETLSKTVRDIQAKQLNGNGTLVSNKDFSEKSDWSDNMVIQNRQSITSTEKMCVNGQIKELEVRKSPIFDEQGNMVGIVGSARDVTPQRQMEKELVDARNKAEESEKLKSAFLANMSHEIRTPMNTILGFVSLLQEADLEEKERVEYLQIVRNSSERLLNTLSDIVDLSKVEAGFATPTYSDFDLLDLFMNLYVMQKKTADEKQLLFIRQWNIPQDLMYINSDKEKVFSIASNLVNNAIKYTNQGFVEFRCQITRNRLEIAVKDTGIGIPENKLQSIFERFIQVDTSHQRLYEGAGLGLSISKAYVDMLGGTISVESELGKGSVFTVSLPITITDVFLHDA